MIDFDNFPAFWDHITGGGALGDLPVDDEVFIGGLLVTDRTHPGWLLLVHLDVECGVKALQVGACQRPAWDHQPHLPQLHSVCTHVQSGHIEVTNSRDEMEGI